MATAQGRRDSCRETLLELADRLRERRAEIEQATLTRVCAIFDPTQASRPEYGQGLRAAIAAALDYGFETIERGEERTPPVPGILLGQARLAAREGVSLDTVLRQYFAGHTLLSDFLIEEAEGHPDAPPLQSLARAQATLCDRVLAAVSEEYTREAQKRLRSSEQRRTQRVERLLAGELLDTSGLAYDFEVCHLGAIAAGAGAAEALRDLAATLERRLLLVNRGQTVWAWLGGRRNFDPEHLEEIVCETWPAEISLAIGEPVEGLSGWRLTHRQARAALPIAMRKDEAFTRYVDVALLASMLQDDLLCTSLRQLYLRPLEEERDGGEVLYETLRAYFEAERNVSSAAAALKVNRHTVANRLRAVERRLGRSLSSCTTELEAALHLAVLSPPSKYMSSAYKRRPPMSVTNLSSDPHSS